MRFPIGALSVGDILDRGLKLLLARLSTFYVINLLVLLPALPYQLVLPFLLIGQPSTAQLLILAGGLLVLLLSSILLTPLGSGAILYIIAQEFADRQASIGSAFAFAWRRFGSLVLASLIWNLIFVAGFLSCLAPGIVFAVFFAFVLQSIVVEGCSAVDAFGRSQVLTRGFRGRVLAVLLLLFLLFLGAFGVQLGVSWLLPGLVPRSQDITLELAFELASYPNYVIGVVIGFLVTTLAGTYYSVCLTLFYFDLRIRKEGYDLELAAKQQAGEVP
jgi:hypothetical protein